MKQLVLVAAVAITTLVATEWHPTAERDVALVRTTPAATVVDTAIVRIWSTAADGTRS